MAIFCLAVLLLLILQRVIPLNGEFQPPVANLTSLICCHETWEGTVGTMAAAITQTSKDMGKVNADFMKKYKAWKVQKESKFTNPNPKSSTDPENYCDGWFFLQCGAGEMCECLESIYEPDKNSKLCLGKKYAFCNPAWNLNCMEGLVCTDNAQNKELKFCKGTGNRLNLNPTTGLCFVSLVLLNVYS